ncbi:ATP-binding protein [Paenibacillus peoriae]|uniref:two-component system sensor histidine kinase NtrB n=1 Tax=Paenibacillus peoriae TaxID=59893 RepID=UPI00026C5870|nr:ATP-binding protein [Paenibacillus peoriae]MEC0182336.1 ATP-binding protein [Paenibacillus peoriae]
MLIALKESVLQVLLAVISAGFFSILTDYGDKKKAWGGKLLPGPNQEILYLCCLPAILLCSLFQYQSPYGLPSNLGIIPLAMGAMYGRRRTAFVIAASALMGVLAIAQSTEMSHTYVATGFILFPFMLLHVKFFQRGTLSDKRLLISGYVVVDMLLKAVFPLLWGKKDVWVYIPDLLTTLWNIAAGVLASFTVVSLMHNAFEKLALRRDVSEFTNKYLIEADKLRQVMDLMPLALVTLDSEERVIHMNKTMLELYRDFDPFITLPEVVGRPWTSIYDFNTSSVVNERVAKALQGEASADFINVPPKVFFCSFLPMQDKQVNKTTGAIIALQDITELETLRSELGNFERLSLVGQMAAGITHEIRNPMAVVRGFLQLMREKSPDSLGHYYRIVMEELDRANGIINDFLSLAQNRIVEKEQCHLHDIIRELTPLLWADANLRGQTIELKLEDHVTMLHLNPKEMKQLLLNLSRNAMEAMGEKGVLTISTHEEGDFVELEVKDTGPGIPQNQLEKLFQPFYTTKTKGTGLGLALCQSIVERHHGTIAVDSVEGMGTQFRVRLRRTIPAYRDHSEPSVMNSIQK